MNDKIEIEIKKYWTDIFESDIIPSYKNKDNLGNLNSIQDFGILISQIIEPTIDILFKIGILIYIGFDGYNKIKVNNLNEEDAKSKLLDNDVNIDKKKISKILKFYDLKNVDINDVLINLIKKIIAGREE